MPDTLVVKQGKDFTIMNKQHISFFILLISVCLFVQCKKNVVDTSSNFFTPVQFKTSLNLSLPQYIILNQPQGFVYITEGNKGSVVINLPQGGFVAYDRTCSHMPTDSCARVIMDRNFSGLKCGTYANDTTINFTPCCGSEFEINNGTAIKKPASIPLKQYFTSFDEGQKILYVSSVPF